MKILLALALLCFSAGAAFTADPKTQGVQAKMDSIVIPEIDLKDVKLHEALLTLMQLSIAADTESDPKKKGVNIVLKGPEEKRVESVTLTMKDATVGDIAQMIAKQHDLQVRPEAYAIAFVPNKQ